jgi:DNA-binding NtrC family response regulator
MHAATKFFSDRQRGLGDRACLVSASSSSTRHPTLSRPRRHLLRLRRLADRDTTVLIEGESGTWRLGWED